MLVSAAAARSASRPPCCSTPCAICIMERSNVIPVWVAGWSASVLRLSETPGGFWTSGPAASATEQKPTASRATANVRKRRGRNIAESPYPYLDTLPAQKFTQAGAIFAWSEEERLRRSPSFTRSVEDGTKCLLSRFGREVSGVRPHMIFRVDRVQINRPESAVLLEVGWPVFQQILAAQLFFDAVEAAADILDPRGIERPSAGRFRDRLQHV